MPMRRGPIQTVEERAKTARVRAALTSVLRRSGIHRRTGMVGAIAGTSEFAGLRSKLASVMGAMKIDLSDGQCS
jgi:hypothetical protein